MAKETREIKGKIWEKSTDPEQLGLSRDKAFTAIVARTDDSRLRIFRNESGSFDVWICKSE